MVMEEMVKISQFLQNYWRAHLPDTIISLSRCSRDVLQVHQVFNGLIYWIKAQEQILSKSLVAEKKLINLLMKLKRTIDLALMKKSSEDLVKGCMIVLQTGIKSKDKIKFNYWILRKILDTDHLSKNINSRPNISFNAW